MGSMSDQLENDVLALIFQGGSITNIPTVTTGNFYIALYTTNPTDTAGSGTETVYTNYARQPVLRISSAWTISGTSPTQCVNANQISFPTCGATGATITGFQIMSAVTGGTPYFWGALTASLAVSNGITPQIAAGALQIQLD